MLSFTNNYWMAVERNLQRAWGTWGRLLKIFRKEKADKITAGVVYVAVVQAVLRFGSKTWVPTPRLDKSLE